MHTLLALVLSAAPASWACPGKTADACESSPEREADPSHCAKKADLVGSNCSYTTGMMAQRVLEEGTPYTYVGRLVATPNELDSRVAAPFVVGPDPIHLVANEIVDTMARDGATVGRVELVGKLLQVDGVKYLVATSWGLSSS